MKCSTSISGFTHQRNPFFHAKHQAQARTDYWVIVGDDHANLLRHRCDPLYSMGEKEPDWQMGLDCLLRQEGHGTQVSCLFYLNCSQTMFPLPDGPALAAPAIHNDQ